MRWSIEKFYEDAKGEYVLKHYQGWRWDCLHRHLALVMLTYTFLIVQSLARVKPPEAGIFPSARPISLPAYHRQVLTWLFQDLVLWLIETYQIKFFRPYRN
jgi:hypothetical protein